MGKHASDEDKSAFLVHLQYVHYAEATRRAGLGSSTAFKVKDRAAEVEIEHAKKGLPPPTLREQIARKPGTGAKPKISVEEVTFLLKDCTLNKKQRKKP